MAKILRGKIVLVFALLALLINSCVTNEGKTENSEKFVRLDNELFYLEGERFFPIMINYVADFRMVEGECILGVHKLYEKPMVYEYFTADSVKLQRNEHLKLIAEMGFNTIRLCLDRISVESEIQGYGTEGRFLSMKSDEELLLKAIEEFIVEAEKNELKILLLIAPPMGEEILEEYTISLLKRFQDRFGVFAYDFNNEPLYDRAHSALSKEEIVERVTIWRDWMDDYAPDQLLTIGFSEPIEVFAWDPSILPVDFLAFHSYNPLRFPSEIYWYTNYSKKPWIIGETALLADGEEIPFDWQTEYMKKAFELTVRCGGIGFGWWGFQEVPLLSYAEEGTGLMTSDGIVYTSDSLLPITAKMKPAVEAVKTLDFQSVKGHCEIPENYFNMLGYSNYVLSGILLDEDGKPIEGGLVRGWNKYYLIGQNTYTDHNGEFNLFSNDTVFHVMISAAGKEKMYKENKQQYTPVNELSPEESSLPNRDLEYQKIDYRNYMVLSEDSSRIEFFKYKDHIFNSAQYEANLGSITLKDWD